MSGVDTRQINRDSLFLVADVRREGDTHGTRVRVRNLSAGGMMAEGDLVVVRGSRVTVDLKNVGPVEGNVAWVQSNRCGIAFARPIDPQLPPGSFRDGERIRPRVRIFHPISPQRDPPDRRAEIVHRRRSMPEPAELDRQTPDTLNTLTSTWMALFRVLVKQTTSFALVSSVTT